MSQQLKLYRIFTALTLAGLVWLIIERLIPHSPDTTFCLFKWATGIPCPSCGTTSALILILRGEFIRAFMFNPLGYVAGLALVILPCWLFTDQVRNTPTFYKAYVYGEHLLRKKAVFIPVIFLLMVNWYWSFVKMI